MYLAAHANPCSRALHYPGAFLGVASLAAVGAKGDWRWLYAFAWLGHLLEHNRPATFRHPYWSFVSDLRMLAFPVPSGWIVS
jgi:hypothetical protein